LTSAAVVVTNLCNLLVIRKLVTKRHGGREDAAQ
jgi:hypothetical protein